jgi:hypothetical protein
MDSPNPVLGIEPLGEELIQAATQLGVRPLGLGNRPVKLPP